MNIPNSLSNVRRTFSRLVKDINDGAAARAVSHRLPTALAWVRALVSHVGFVVDKSALGQVSPEHFSF
jgi:hypothetical protein